jgi:hypothetical protein
MIARRKIALVLFGVLVLAGCGKAKPVTGPPFGERASLDTIIRGYANALTRHKSFRFSVDVQGDPAGDFWFQSRAGAAKTDGSQWWAYTFTGLRLPPESEWPRKFSSIGRWRAPGWLNTHFKEIGCRQPYEKFNNRACAMSLAENFVAVWGLGDDPNSIKKQLSGYIESLKTATPVERARADALLAVSRTEMSRGIKAYVYSVDFSDHLSTYRNGERREIGVSSSGLPVFVASYVVDDKSKQLVLRARSEIYGFDEKVVQPEDPLPGQR